MDHHLSPSATAPAPGVKRRLRLLAGAALVTTLGSILVLPAAPAAAVPLTELVANGTFDTTTGPWWNSQNTTAGIVAGRLCADVAGGTANVWDAVVGQSGLALSSGRAYTLSFDASASTAMTIRARVQVEGTSHPASLDHGVQVNGDLRRISLPFTAAATSNAGQVVLQLGGRPQAVTVCLDNVSLQETELIGNGAFDGDTSTWWRSAGRQLALDSQRLRVDVAAGTTQLWDDMVGQSGVRLRAGQSYRLTFDASASAGRTIQAVVQRENAPHAAPLSRPVALGADVRQVSYTFTSPFSVTDGQLLFQFGGSGAYTAWLDNVSLVELPEGPFDPMRYWNDVLLETYAEETGTAAGPTVLGRAGAMVLGAMYDAATSVVPTGQPYLTRVSVPADSVAASPEAAINKAAHAALVAAFPGRNFDADLSAATAQLPNGVSQAQLDRSSYIGAQAAAAMVQARSNDGAANDAPYQLDNVPGAWRPTDSRPALAPNWGLVTPFTMTSGSQFRPAPPLGATSYAHLLAKPAYGVQVNEVKDYGARNSTVRTAEQTQIAHFWANDLDGTYKPPGQLLEHTAILAEQRGLPLMEKVRLFGLVGLALGDAGIVARDGKFLTAIDLWRPETAIRLADQDGVAETVKDEHWQPLSKDHAGNSFSPPFPAYASGHATFAGAWAGIMRRYFGTDDMTFTLTTVDPYATGVTRSFTGFGAAAEENAISRIYLGVHFRFDAEAGLASGDGLAQHVFANHLRP